MSKLKVVGFIDLDGLKANREAKKAVQAVFDDRETFNGRGTDNEVRYEQEKYEMADLDGCFQLACSCKKIRVNNQLFPDVHQSIL